jgi:hypothetical protein
MELIAVLMLAAAGAGMGISYVKVRDFVRTRLRFVDTAQKPAAPWIAGIAGALVAAPIVALLPVLGAPTAVVYGVVVGVGVRSGQKHVKQITGG